MSYDILSCPYEEDGKRDCSICSVEPICYDSDDMHAFYDELACFVSNAPVSKVLSFLRSFDSKDES